MRYENGRRLARRTAVILAIMTPLALMSPTLAVAHEGWRDDSRTVSAKKAASAPAAKVGETCKKKGKVKGQLTCARVKGKLTWVKTPRTSTTSTGAAASAPNVLCRNSTYTSQVRDLKCTATTITFAANGLPGGSAPTMIGITATNQQYPSAHDYTYSIPRKPAKSATPTVPGDGAIGVAVNGVPLFSPWTQSALLQHTLDAGELDKCGGHAGRGDDYHYHVAPNCLIEELGATKVEKERSPIGIANDAYPILALGWFDTANNVESKLDKCRGMTDDQGNYFYNVQSTRKWNILDCFTGTVFKTSKDRFTSRTDSAGNQITGAKLSMTITDSSSRNVSGQTCYVMSGNLTNQKIVQTNQSVNETSGPAGIFYCNPQCYAEFFEPTAAFPGQSVYLEKVTSNCPAGFNPDSVPTLPPYRGPDIGKRGPATGSSAPPPPR